MCRQWTPSRPSSSSSSFSSGGCTAPAAGICHCCDRRCGCCRCWSDGGTDPLTDQNERHRLTATVAVAVTAVMTAAVVTTVMATATSIATVTAVGGSQKRLFSITSHKKTKLKSYMSLAAFTSGKVCRFYLLPPHNGTPPSPPFARKIPCSAWESMKRPMKGHAASPGSAATAANFLVLPSWQCTCMQSHKMINHGIFRIHQQIILPHNKSQGKTPSPCKY
jgi:hypothetical protein